MGGSGLPPFHQVVDTYGADVWRFAVSQVGPERAEDVFQEAMVAALAAYPRLRDAAAVRSWLLRITARKAVDAFRGDTRAPLPVADPDPGAAPADPEPPDEALWRRVRALPAKQRQAVALRFVLDLDYAAVGEAMDTSTEAARRNVFEGVRTLRRRMSQPPSPTP